MVRVIRHMGHRLTAARTLARRLRLLSSDKVHPCQLH
jgi:hypothetical protein